ncbi:flagellar basal-body MS-ring/collar protein FliF [Nocardioides sp. GY 10127]|uniref:flagellar basal-body MS-ring/collar protein FliF n=1 Tax=Nocardioides sp. GY 10127 TaxID=2569762 RepID=UPI0010A8B8C7|nr:flagellar basal-body MS-ring/collar protein FliF [Nocardioides sp. GY 10127]TIC78627.1 flagellar M-ring protein FliF [Nocardioides sp. GY 10127]
MRETTTRYFNRLRSTFASFTAGQKAVVVVGGAAVLLAGFMVYRWAAAPTYSPLFSNLSASDASAVVDELDATGVSYELTDGGTTIMVPKDEVYPTRIQLSGQGLPADTGTDGYSILDDQGISTSEFQEQTDYKRAMEGELDNTIEAIDGVDTAVVHLAIPQKDVFTSEQQPTTASVLVGTRTGTTLSAEQVQAIVHLVASSVDGLDPDNVTVADATGKVLSAPGGTASADASARTQQEAAVQDALHTKLQTMLDQVVGPGNATVQVTAQLDFDKSTTETLDYQPDRTIPALTESAQTETYTSADGTTTTGNANGVVGVNGQTEVGNTNGNGSSSYENSSSSRTNGVDTVRNTTESTPGAIQSLHVGVVLDSTTTQAISAADVQNLVASTIGIDQQRGDTVSVLSMPFDRTAADSAAAELAAAQAADAAAAKTDLYKKGALAGAIALMLLIAWFRARRRAKARTKAATMVVEQITAERAALAAANAAPAELALAEADENETDLMREELAQIIDRQPDEVADLLRGWLAEKS